MELKATLDFLKRLKKNNNKEWFDRNKKEYDELRKEWIGFVEGLITSIGKFDPGIAGLEAKRCIFRINRDIRFSKDKSPYKTNFGASINPGGKNAFSAGYYIHLEPSGCFLAGGLYLPEPELLSAVRQEIDYNLDEFKGILAHKDFKKYFGTLGGDKLSRPPKGYDADNPAVEFLKHKSFLAYHQVKDTRVNEKNYRAYAAGVFKAMNPLVRFMNRSLS